MRSGSFIRPKKGKKSQWGNRERAGMSFLIVIAFFAVFGLIILTEVLMMDERSRNPISSARHMNMNNRFAESVPDYDEIKDDYLDEPGLFVRENKAGDALKNFLKETNKAAAADAAAVQNNVVAAAEQEPRGVNMAAIPWGQMLPTKIENSLPPYPKETRPTDGSWQFVNGTRYKFFVFSAYYDRRDGRMIRVIGATKTRNAEKVWCRLWYPVDANRTRFTSATIMARVKVIRENWNLKYSAVFVLCPLRIAYLEVPYAVSVVSKLRQPPGNVLLVRNTDWDADFSNRTVQDIPNKMGICVKPLHFEYDQALHLLEFIELNAILGFTHFTFYNHTIGPKASCILENYMNDGVAIENLINANANISNNSSSNNHNHNRNSDSNNITENINQSGPNNNDGANIFSSGGIGSSGLIRPKVTIDLLAWNLRMRSQKEIRTEGLFASLNDCLYRSMYRFAHVALIDLDEFMIPKHNDSLQELIETLSKRANSRNTGAYSFQNAFFYLQFPDDSLMYEEKSTNPSLRAALITQRKTRRRSKLHPQKQRSKYICKPEAVVEAGNHFVWEFLPGRNSFNVPADAAILHHYRVCEFGGDDCIKSPSVVDHTAHKYGRRLIDRIQIVYDYLKDRCKLPNLPPPPTRPPEPRVKSVKFRNQTMTGNANVAQQHQQQQPQPVVKPQAKTVSN